MAHPSAVDFTSIVEHLRLAILVFRGARLLYVNRAAHALRDRLREEYQVDLLVMLRDHLQDLEQHEHTVPEVTLLTAARGEPFYVHVVPLSDTACQPDGLTVSVSVRELGIEREAFARRYQLSGREAEVAELVLRGYGNTQIASALGIAPATAKRHITRIFDKIGVNSRTQLISRLA